MLSTEIHMHTLENNKIIKIIKERFERNMRLPKDKEKCSKLFSKNQNKTTCMRGTRNRIQLFDVKITRQKRAN